MKEYDRDELFLRARGGGGATDADRQRVRAALSRKLGVATGVAVGVTAAKASAGVGVGGGAIGGAGSGAGAGIGVGGAGVAATAGTALSGIAFFKGVAVVVAGMAVAFAVVPARSPRVGSSATAPTPLSSPPSSHSPSSPSSHPAPAPDLHSAPARDRARDPAPAPSPAVSPAPSAFSYAAPTPTPTTQAPSEDLALISEMQLALRNGDTARALTLVGEHERRFPTSAWVQERDGVRVLAQCGMAEAASGERREPRRLGQAFLDRYPLSPLGARVRGACGL